MHFAGVTNLATGKPVRVIAHFSNGPWAVIVDGIVGPGLSNFERMEIDSGNCSDSIWGSALEETISSGGGSDQIRGFAGDDRISKTYGRYDLNGGSGVDMLSVSQTNAKDQSAALTFDAIAGTLLAGTSSSGTFVNFERFEVSGTLNDDVIGLGKGDDRGFGGAGADQISGDFGNDMLDGGTGADTLEFMGTLANIDLTGATLSGIESIRYSTTSTFALWLKASLVNQLDNFTLAFGRVEIKSAGNIALDGDLFVTSFTLFSGGQQIDLSASTRPFSDFGPAVFGGAGSDTMIGSDRRDSFVGQDGNDSLFGGIGRDTMSGGLGSDLLQGGGDDDLLIGDAGVDRMNGGSGQPRSGRKRWSSSTPMERAGQNWRCCCGTSRQLACRSRISRSDCATHLPLRLTK